MKLYMENNENANETNRHISNDIKLHILTDILTFSRGEFKNFHY